MLATFPCPLCASSLAADTRCSACLSARVNSLSDVHLPTGSWSTAVVTYSPGMLHQTEQPFP